MHGVLKVKTTAEQEAERKKERAEKAEKFMALTEEIFNKRKNEELDDELLKLTEKLLGSNPDFSTMWNIRKEIFLKIKQQRSDDEMNELFLHELKFLQSCLHVNPKSYGVWEHRRFALQNMPSPDWERDLMLCNKFLSMDSRNFHCWDYRRFVVKNANVSSKEEFDFTTKKISENFSNYSAWHNRAKLLPLVHPDPQCKGKVEETALLREFGLVQNAFFTDPNDQSAWFYQRWLLGREEQKLDILYIGVKRTSDGLRLVVSLSKKVQLNSQASIDIFINNEKLDNQTWSSSSLKLDPSHVWIANIKTNLDDSGSRVIVEIGDGTKKECTLKQGENEASWSWHLEESHLMFRDSHTAAKADVLNNELESCKMLLEEESENKWVMLTVVFLMRALDPERYSDETESLLKRLVDCDGMRREYYRDLRSKYQIEDEIRRMKRAKDDFQTLNLEEKDLTALYHLEYLTSVKTINLSSNKMTSLHNVHMLQNLTQINLDANEVDCLDGFSLVPHLEDLSLKVNKIAKLEELQKLRNAPSLKQLCLSDNPVFRSPLAETEQDFLSKLNIVDLKLS